MSFGSGMTRSSTTRESFRVPIETPLDIPDPVHATTAVLRNSANLELRPVGSLTSGFSASWDHDLHDYGDSTTVARIAQQSRDRLLGLNVGFVRARQLQSRFTWTPPVASWLRPRVGWNSAFTLSRDPTAAQEEREFGDSAGAFRLPTVFSTTSSLDLNAALDLSRMLRGPFRDSSAVRKVLDRVTQLNFGRRREHRSQYDRPGFDPSLGYQFGLSDPRSHQGRLANAAAEITQDRINASLRAPFGVTLTSVYAEREVLSIFLRSGEQQEQRALEKEWPNVNARWLWSPRAGWVRRYLTSVSANVGYLKRQSLSEFLAIGTGSGLRASQSSRSTPVSLGLSWASRVTTTFTFSEEKSLADRSGNQSRGDRRNAAADVSFSFRAPREFVPLPSDVRTSLRWQRAQNHSCVERAGLGSCIVIADSRRSEYNLTMDTDLPPSVTAGLSVAYVLSDDRHLNRKFSQFALTLSARFFFNAGEVR